MKKILCGVLSLAMLFGSLGTAAYADGYVRPKPITGVDISDGTTIKNSCTTGTQIAEVTGSNINLKKTDDGVNYALFDGSAQQYIEIGENPYCVNDTTTEMWVMLDETDSNDRALFSAGTTPSNYTYKATVANGKLKFSMKNKADTSKTASGECDLPSDYAGKWIYLVFVESAAGVNQVTFNIYVNPKTAEPTPSLTVGPCEMSDESDYSNIFVGATGSNKNKNKDNGMKGKLAAFDVYQTSWTATDIYNAYITSPSNLTGITVPGPTDPIDPVDPSEPTGPSEPSDPDTPKEGGLVYDLEIGETLAKSYDKYQPTKALNYNTAGTAPTVEKFRGVDSDFNYIRFNDEYGTADAKKRAPLNIDTTNVSPSDALTFEIWFRLNATGAENTTAQTCFMSVKATGNGVTKDIFQAMTYQNYSLMLKAFANTSKDGTITSTSVTDGAAQPAAGGWHHLVITRSKTDSSATLKAWIDGASKVNKTVDLENPQISESSYQISICGWPNGANGETAADIADFKVYTKELTDSEVLASYNESKAGFATPEFYYDSDTKSPVDSGSVELEATLSDSDITSAVDNKLLKLTDGDGNEISASFEKKDGGLTVSFNQYLRYGMKLKLENLQSGSYSYISVEDGAATFTAAKQTNGNVKIRIEKSGSDTKTYKYAVISRRSDGAAILAKAGEAEFAENCERYLPYAAGADKIYVYVWEVSGSKLIPVKNSPIVLE